MKRGLLILLGIACCFASSIFIKIVVSQGINRAVTLPRNNAPATSTTTDDPEINIPHATIAYYDIVGSTEKELRRQLNALGPVSENGQRFDAMTKWFIHWNWPGYGNTDCQLEEATTSYEIQVIFPRWTPPKHASAALVAKWNRYIQALAEHEKGHVRFVTDNFPLVEKAIRAASCNNAEAAAQAQLTKIRQLDVDYDNETEHGRTQKAQFP